MIQDPKLIEKLTNIHKTLTSVLKDDSDYKKFAYSESEINTTVDYKAVNEKIAYNRLKKLQALKLLSENWESFKTHYANDNILNKIGEEFIDNKFECSQRIIKTIEEYPFKEQTLYYFAKNSPVQVPLNPSEYENIKNQILPELELNSKKTIEIKEKLLSIVKQIRENKSQSNLEKMFAIHEKSNSGFVKGDLGSFMQDLALHLKRSDFHYEQQGSRITVQVPIAGERECSGVYKKIGSSLFSVDLNNLSDYSIQVGTIQKPIIKIQDKINLWRDSSLDNDITFKPKI